MPFSLPGSSPTITPLKGYTSTKDFLDDNPRIGRKETFTVDPPAEAFLQHLEKELKPVRSYKMVVMKVLLSLPGTGWNVNDIAQGFLAYYLGHPDRLSDYVELSRHPRPEAFPLARVKSHLLKNPLKYMSNTAKDWFILEQDRFRLKPAVASHWDEPVFRRLVEDRVEFTLTRYFHLRRSRPVKSVKGLTH